jgi:hypothetical protein
MSMTDYAWFPVSGMPAAGTTITATTTLTWNNGTFNWNTGSNWIDASAISFTGNAPVSGNIPDSGTGTSQGAGADSVGLIAGTINPGDLAFYNFLAPGQNDPTITSSELSTDVLLNSGTVDLDNLLMAGFGISEPAIYPTLDVEGADFIVGGTIVNSETVDFPAGIGDQSATGGGTIDLGTGGTFEAGGSVQADIVFNFRDADSDILKLDAVSVADTAAFNGTIVSFGAGDTIWLPNVPATLDSVVTTADYDPIGQTVTLSIGDPTTITIDLAGTILTTDSSVLVQADANGGIDLVTCFAAGTRIATPRGEVAVEDLREGDSVEVLLDGTVEPVVWVGHRHLDCRRHPNPKQTWPVRIRAGAFGPGQPYRDLLLSPDHSVYANDVLIPVKRLVNGSTIEQIKVDEIDYYHVELRHHSVLLANGLPTESYLDVANHRAFFANGSAPVVLHPDLTALAWEANGCAPLVVTGPELDAVRARLSALANEELLAVA